MKLSRRSLRAPSAGAILPSAYGRLGFESVTGREDPFSGNEGRRRDWLEYAVHKIHEDTRRRKPHHAELAAERKRANGLSQRLKEATATLIAENDAKAEALAEARERAASDLERFAAAAIRAKLVAVYVSPPNPPRLEARGVKFEAPECTEEATALAKELVRWWLHGGGVDGKSEVPA